MRRIKLRKRAFCWAADSTRPGTLSLMARAPAGSAAAARHRTPGDFAPVERVDITRTRIATGDQQIGLAIMLHSGDAQMERQRAGKLHAGADDLQEPGRGGRPKVERGTPNQDGGRAETGRLGAAWRARAVRMAELMIARICSPSACRLAIRAAGTRPLSMSSSIQ